MTPTPETSEASSKVPRHVAIIMDGNGRWARQRGMMRVQGHRAGAESVRAVVDAAGKAGVEYLTLYAFSVENWSRPESEVSTLMKLLHRFLRDEISHIKKSNIRLSTIGRIHDLPDKVRAELESAIEQTRHHTGLHLILALSYGARVEITDAVQAIARKAAAGELDADAITQDTIADHLYTRDVPDPDLLIRTSGEMRLSNFLLWQMSYAEIYVTETLWPEFRSEQFLAALESYAKRQRRFGGVIDEAARTAGGAAEAVQNGA